MAWTIEWPDRQPVTSKVTYSKVAKSSPGWVGPNLKTIGAVK